MNKIPGISSLDLSKMSELVKSQLEDVTSSPSEVEQHIDPLVDVIANMNDDDINWTVSRIQLTFKVGYSRAKLILFQLNSLGR